MNIVSNFRPGIATALATALFTSTVVAQVGSDNPTGTSGAFNGSVTTGGSYDAYTANATRSITDLDAPGSVGAYPLAFTRTMNSRYLVDGKVEFGPAGTWSHNFQWRIPSQVLLTDASEDPEPLPSAYAVDYPDGRRIVFSHSAQDSAAYRAFAGSGISDRFKPLGDVSGGYCYLLLPDGGKIQFAVTVSRVPFQVMQVRSTFTFKFTGIVDPHGQFTSVTYPADGSMTVQEPAGRQLKLFYVTFNGGTVLNRVEQRAHEGAAASRSVQYNYVTHPGSGGQTALSSVVYFGDPNLTATYTYQNSNVNSAGRPLLSTANDPMYGGPMRSILYEYATGTGVAHGQILREKHPNGTHVSTLTINGNSRTETRGDGRQRTFNYTGGKLTSYTDFKNQSSSISYDAHGFTSAFTDARGKTTATSREPLIGALSVLTHPDPEQSTQRFAYRTVNGAPYFLEIRGDERHFDSNTYFVRDPVTHRVTKIWYPDYPSGPTEEFTYNSFGQVLTHKKSSGGTTGHATHTFTYDARQRLATSVPPATPSDLNPGSHPTRFNYYESGPNVDRLHYVTDPRGFRTWFEYNTRGQITKVTHEDDSFRQMGYNSDGTLAWSADENHPNAATDVTKRTRYVYDDYKRVTSVTNPLDQTTTFNYAQDWVNSYLHTTSSVKGVFSPLGKQTHFAYDENWRRTILRQAPDTGDDAWTWSGYDAVGNLTSVQDPRGNITTFAYDNRNRRISATNPAPFNNQITRWEYDTRSNLTKEIRPDQAFRRTEYDSMSRVKDTYGFGNEHIHYERDLAGNVIEMKDPKEYSYFFTYDALNRKITATYPPDVAEATRTETWHYDAAGSMVEYKNRAGARKVFAPYDNRNRPTSFSWHDEAPGQSTQGQSFAYDAVGNITGLQNAEANLGFTYDAANRKTSETQTIKSYGLNQTHTVTYEYDADGNRSRFVYPQGWDYRYAYTDRNQLTSIRLASSGTPSVQYAYDAAGNRSRRTIYYGAYTDYSHNALNQLYSQTSYFNGATARFDYGFDAANRIKYEQRDSGAADGFSYNPGDQLTGFNQNGTLNANGTVSAAYNVSISYDANGNRIDAFDGGNAHYNTAPSNQYSSDWTGAISYDDNANLITRAGWTFTYDAQNRLVKIQSGSTVIHYHYDPLNRIVARDTNGAITTQVWDDWKLIEEREANDAFRRMYFHGAATNEIVAAYGPAYGDAFYFQDGRGNVTHLTGPWNNVIERYTYFVSGQPNYLSGNSMDNRFLFQGALFVPEAEIYDMRNRFYHPNLGRFLQSDPIGFAAGDTNLYRYCGGDPVNRTDPSGLWQVTIFAAYKGGAYGTFGWNNGQWNFGAALGYGYGAYIGIDPLPSRIQPTAINHGVIATVGQGVPGVSGVRLTGYFGEGGNRVWGTARLGHVSHGFETDGTTTRFNDSPTFSLGGGFFIGFGQFHHGPAPGQAPTNYGYQEVWDANGNLSYSPWDENVIGAPVPDGSGSGTSSSDPRSSGNNNGAGPYGPGSSAYGPERGFGPYGSRTPVAAAWEASWGNGSAWGLGAGGSSGALLKKH